MRILITGAAGFIGFHLARRLLTRGDEVIGLDNLNDYYDVSLKRARLARLEPFKNFRFERIDVSDRTAMERFFRDEVLDRVLHMAAQAGVRYSLENPHAYVQANLVGFINVLEGCRRQWCGKQSLIAGRWSLDKGFVSDGRQTTRHLVYASSSSVYGLNTKMPFSVTDNVDYPISLYGATKKANELMAHTYSYLYGIPTTGLRFFTVYGPWGRPDMALFKFTKAILNGDEIDVYNEGRMRRDFTYIDDVVEGAIRIADKIPSPLACPEQGRRVGEGQGEEGYQATGDRRLATAAAAAPYRLYNIGSNNPVELLDFIHAIEDSVGRKAEMRMLPMQPGDVPATYADVADLSRDIGFAPNTPVREGIAKFVEWYRNYYKV